MKKLLLITGLVVATFALTSCGSASTEDSNVVESVEVSDSTVIVEDSVVAVDSISAN